MILVLRRSLYTIWIKQMSMQTQKPPDNSWEPLVIYRLGDLSGYRQLTVLFLEYCFQRVD